MNFIHRREVRIHIRRGLPLGFSDKPYPSANFKMYIKLKGLYFIVLHQGLDKFLLFKNLYPIFYNMAPFYILAPDNLTTNWARILQSEPSINAICVEVMLAFRKLFIPLVNFNIFNTYSTYCVEVICPVRITPSYNHIQLLVPNQLAFGYRMDFFFIQTYPDFLLSRNANVK